MVPQKFLRSFEIFFFQLLALRFSYQYEYGEHEREIVQSIGQIDRQESLTL